MLHGNLNGREFSAPASDEQDVASIPSHGQSGDYILVPDTHLLFHAEFKRLGNDLKLVGEDGKSFLIVDYFRHEHRAKLVSPEGAGLTGDLVEALAGPLNPGQYAQATPAQSAAELVGKVVLVQGSAQAVRNGVAITLNTGDAILRGDVVQTGADSALGIIFTDSTTFNLTANARMVINEFVYDPNGSANSALINLVQGTISMVAGQVAKSGDMKVSTPVATMGIRGTAILIEIAADNGATKFSVMVEPSGVVGSFNLYDKVTGALLGTVSNSSVGWLVRPVNPTEVFAQQLTKSAEDLQKELAIVQQVFQMQSVGQQLLNLQDPNTKLTNNNGTQFVVSDRIGINFSDGLSTPKTTTISFSVVGGTGIGTGDQFGVFPDNHPPVANPDLKEDNDSVVEAGVQPGNTSFAGTPMVTGNVLLNDTDPDGDSIRVIDVTAISPRLHAVANGVVVDSDGNYSYTLDNSDPEVQALALGETITDIFSYTIADTSGATATSTLTITIVGTNDQPVIESSIAHHQGAVTEDTNTADGFLALSDTIAFRDVDLHDTHIAAWALKSAGASADLPGYLESGTLSPIGTFALDPAVTENIGDAIDTGTLGWSFTLANDDPVLQSLAAGQTLTQVYTVTITDNNGASASQDITITITGTNDGPVITSGEPDHQGAVTEEANFDEPGNLTASDSITFRDLDLIDTHIATFALKSSDANADLPGFAEGLGTGAAVIGTFAIDQAVTENSADTDNTATLGWSFTLANNNATLQSLAAGQTITQVYTVTVTDNNNVAISQDITVTITGTNDGPVITSAAGDHAGAVTEDTDAVGGNLFASDTITFQDVDLIDTHTASFALKSSDANADLPGFNEGLGTGAANIGTFALAAIGESASDTDNTATLGWSFTLANNNAVLQSLAAGQIITQIYTVTLDDGHGGSVDQDITITITGTNDGPAINHATAVASGGVSERADGAADENSGDLTASGTIAFADVDLINTHTVAAALISAIDSATGNATAARGSFVPSMTDVSAGDGSGTVTWNYAVAAGALDDLALAQTITQTYQVTITDSSGATDTQTVIITLNGTNDAPFIGSDSRQHPNETTNADPITATIPIVFSDVDLRDVGHTLAVIGAEATEVTQGLALDETALIGLVSLLSIEKNSGSSQGYAELAFSAASTDFDYLAANEHVVITYTVRIDDGDGGSATQTHAVEIAGTNDAPVIAAITQQDLNEQTNTAPLTRTFAVAFSDVDLADVGHSAEITAVAATGVTTGLGLNYQQLLDLISISDMTKVSGSSSGSLNLNFSAASTAFDYLAAGQVLTLTYTLAINDHDGAAPTRNFVVTVTGTNDAPVVTSGLTSLSAMNEDSAPAGTSVATLLAGYYTDADAADGLAGIALVGNQTAASQGQWQYFNGSGWVTIVNTTDPNGPAIGNALLLSGATLLRFLPAADYNGPAPAINGYVVDTSYGTIANGTHVDLSALDAVGGATPYSAQVIQINGTVGPVNDAPLASGSATLAAIDEDTANPSGATVASLFNGNFSDATDQVAGGSSANAFAGIAISSHTADSAKGAWQYSTDSGSNWTALGNASATAAITLAASTLLRFVPAADYNGAATALAAHLIETGTTITNGGTINLSTTGTGGETHYSTGEVALNHTINAVNDVPVASVNPAPTTYPEQGVGALFDEALTVSDIDGANLFGATLRIDDARASDLLKWQEYTSAGVTWADGSGDHVDLSFDGTSHMMSIWGRASLAHYQEVLRAITFSSPNNDPTAGGTDTQRTLTLTLSDGADFSAPVSRIVTITPVNDAPSGADKTVSIDEDSEYTFAAADFGFSDPDDSPANNFAWIVVTTLPAQGELRLDGQAVEPDDVISVADINDGKLTFAPTPDGNGTGYASFTFAVRDDGGTADGGVNTDQSANRITFNVTPVNDAPAFSGLDNNPTYTENSAAVVLDANALLSDIELDAANNYSGATLKLVAENAFDSFGATGTLSFSSGNVVLDGTTVGSVSNSLGILEIVFNSNATAARVDSVLQQITYAKEGEALGATVGISYLFKDGNTGAQGSGGEKTVTGHITVTLVNVNDAPAAAITPASYNATEQTNLTLHGTGLSISDVDAGPSDILSVTLSVGEGIINVVAGANALNGVSSSGTGSVNILGTLAGINNLLAGLNGASITYNANIDSPSASTTLTLAVNDQGHTGSGGSLAASDTATINITAVNDAPAVDLDTTQSGSEYTTVVAPDGTVVAALGSNVATSDVDNNVLQSATAFLQSAAQYTDYVNDDLYLDLSALPGTVDSGSTKYNGSLNSGAITWEFLGGSGGIQIGITGAANLATYNQILDALRFKTTSADLSDRTLSVTVNDGALDSSTAAGTIRIDYAPAFSLTNASETHDDGAHTASLFNLAVTDVDAGSNPLTLTASVTDGTLSHIGALPGGLTVLDADGDASFSVQGTLANINTFLANGLTYLAGRPDGTTTDTLTLTVDDGFGSTGTLHFVFAQPTTTYGPSGVTLAGTSGTDIITGTAGADTMTGNGGVDIFKFAAASDSAPATFDLITDFTPGTDKIDLSLIDANTTNGAGRDAFTFVDNAATPTVNPGVQANSITWYQDSGNSLTIIQADTDGNTVTAELLIKLTGTHVLHASDFVV